MNEMTDSWYGPQSATFGDRLAAAREHAGMTQEDLAKHLGVKTKTVRQWEDDIADPRANRLVRVAGMLGVSIMWLLHGEGDGIAAPDDGLTTEAVNIPAILSELRTLRVQARMQADQIGRLEKRLRTLYESGA